MSINSKVRAARKDKQAILSIPMVFSAATIAAAAIGLPSHVIAAVHTPQSATPKALAECAQEVWPYYSARCLRRNDSAARPVRVIALDSVH
jgi:hypothetical protein